MLSGSTPRLSSAAFTSISPTPFSAFTAIVLPARSPTSLIGLSLPTTMTVHSSFAVFAPVSLLATTCSGRPLETAAIIGTKPRKPNCRSPDTIAVTISLPLWAGTGSISMPSSLKKPCFIPT